MSQLDPSTVDTYAVRMRMMMSPGVWREYGELVPEAHLWYRMESWLHAGKLMAVTVPVEEFKAAVAKYCPEKADALIDAAGIPDDVVPMGYMKTPVLKAPRPTEPPPAPKLVKAPEPAEPA